MIYILRACLIFISRLYCSSFLGLRKCVYNLAYFFNKSTFPHFTNLDNCKCFVSMKWINLICLRSLSYNIYGKLLLSYRDPGRGGVRENIKVFFFV